MKNRFLVFLLLVSSLAYGDRMQNDNIDMQGNAIKNADVQGGTASDTSRITVPKAATATLDGLTRKEGTVVFDSTTKKLKVDNGTVLSAVGSGEGGGGLNAVTNPTAATDLTGYSDSDADAAGNDYIRTDTAAELPLSPAVTTGVKIVPDASSEYIAYCGTMPEALQNRKLRFNQFQKVESGYDSGDMRLEIYPSTSSTCASVGTEYALNKDWSGVTAIPSATQDFWVTFDADGSDYFQIRWVRTNASTEYLVVQNVSIGTGDQASGPPMSGGIAFTPSSPNSSMTFNAASYLEWRRVNNKMHIQGRFTLATVAGSEARIALPFGTVGTYANNSITGSAGKWLRAVAGGSSVKQGPVLAVTGNNYITFSYDDYTTAASPTSSQNASTLWGGTDTIYVQGEWVIPIAEWGDSSNVVNYGQQDVEYAYNSSTSTSTNSTSFAYGQAGVPFYSYAPSGTTAVSKRVRFLSPILKSDLIILEVSPDSGATWKNFESIRFEINEAGTTFVGMKINNVSTQDIDVAFYSKANWAQNWSDYTGGSHLWRVKKISGNALGGFQYATSTASGLVRNGGAPTSLTASDLTGQTRVSIDTADITNMKWKVTDKQVTLWFTMDTITVTAGSSSFYFTLPSSVPRPTTNIVGEVAFYDNSGTNSQAAMVLMQSDGLISFYKHGGGTWTGGTNTNYLFGQLSWPTE